MQQRLQAGRALKVYPHNTVAIPEPSSLGKSGATTSVVAGKLVDSGALFKSEIKPGYIVHNTSDGTATEVLTVDTNTQLTLLDNIFTASPKNYKIYTKPTTGCVLYVGVQGNLDVKTSGGDEVPLVAIQGFSPIAVTHVYASTTATDMVALW